MFSRNYKGKKQKTEEIKPTKPTKEEGKEEDDTQIRYDSIHVWGKKKKGKKKFCINISWILVM